MIEHLALRLIQFAIALIIFIGIIFLMIKKKSNASVSLIWIVIAIGTMVLGLFPRLIDIVAVDWLGIASPPNFVFAMAIMALLWLVFYISSELAIAQTKIRELAMQISLLNSEVYAMKTDKQEEAEF